jgi:hypothetical protein
MEANGPRTEKGMVYCNDAITMVVSCHMGQRKRDGGYDGTETGIRYQRSEGQKDMVMTRGQERQQGGISGGITRGCGK